MVSARLRAEPLRALIALEAAALVLAVAYDLTLMAVQLRPGNAVDLRGLAFYGIAFGIAALAICGIPHAQNRNFFRVAVGIAGILVLNFLPMSALTPAVLLVVLAARLTFSFGFRGMCAAWAAAFISIAVTAAQGLGRHPTSMRIAEALVGACGYCVFITLVFGAIFIVWLYANKAAENATSTERIRIALDLHDSLGHSVTALSVQLQNADRLRSANPDKADAYVKRALHSAGELLAGVRETVAVLHDDADAAPGSLPSKLERLCNEFASTHEVDAVWSVDLAHDLPARTAAALYRVLQEALTNVARHANAQHVEVTLAGSNGAIELRVRDDGQGFNGAHSGGHGILSMRKRVESLAGVLTIDSTAQGTLVRAVIPMPGEE